MPSRASVIGCSDHLNGLGRFAAATRSIASANPYAEAAPTLSATTAA